MTEAPDLVIRLRQPRALFLNGAAWVLKNCKEAADKIERLTRERDRLWQDLSKVVAMAEAAERERDALRATIEYMGAAVDRMEAAEARVAELEEVLRMLAPLDYDEQSSADFLNGVEECVKRARAALSRGDK